MPGASHLTWFGGKKPVARRTEAKKKKKSLLTLLTPNSFDFFLL